MPQRGWLEPRSRFGEWATAGLPGRGGPAGPHPVARVAPGPARRGIGAALGLALAMTASGAAAASKGRDACYDDDASEEQTIAGCTQVIAQRKRVTKDDVKAAFYNRGNAYRGQAQYDRALADFSEAIRIDPGYVLAYRARGSTYDDLAQYDAAIEDLDWAIKLDPSDANAYVFRGIAYANKDDHARAVQNFDEAVRLDPARGLTRYSRALSLEKLDDLDRALTDAKEAARLDTEDEDIPQLLQRLQALHAARAAAKPQAKTAAPEAKTAAPAAKTAVLETKTAAPAVQRRPPAEVYAAYGVTGTWASACDTPATAANPRYTYRPDRDGGLTLDTDFGNGVRSRSTIREASIDAAGRLHAITYTAFDDLNPTARAQATPTAEHPRPGVATAGTWMKGPDGELNLIDGTVTPDGGAQRASVVGGFTADPQTGAAGARWPARLACKGPATTAPPVSALQAPPSGSPTTVTRLGADGYLAENLRVARAPDLIVVPRIEIRGTALAQDDLVRLLDPASPAGLPERLAALQAREVAVPEIRVEGETPAVLRGLRLSDVGSGRIGTLAVDGGQVEIGGQDRLGFSRLEAEGLDLGLLTSLSGPAPAGPAPELRPALDRFGLEGLTLAQAGQATLRVARISGRSYRVRPTAPGWGASLDDAVAALDQNAPPPDLRRGARAAADLLGALAVGSLDVAGVEIVGTPADPMTARLASAGYVGGRDGGEIRLDGLDIDRPDAKVRLAAFSVGGIALAGTEAGLRAVGASDTGEIGPAAARQLLPQVGAVRLGRLEVDVPGSDGRPATVALDSAEVSGANFLNGIPSSLRVALNGLAVPLRAAEAQDPTGQLAALGLETLGLSLRTDIAWNEATRELGLREVSIALRDLGTVTARGVLGDVSRDVFSPDPALAAVAALGATLRTLDLDVEDRGMTDRGMRMFAAAGGTSVDDARTEASAYALVSVQTMLGGSPTARSLGQAVGRFLAKPGRLRVRAVPKGPAGLALSDIAAVQDPVALLNAVEVTATAE